MIKYLSILGSTGSIGRNTLYVAAMFPDRFKIQALAAGKNVKLLSEQIQQFKPELAVVYDEDTAQRLRALLPANDSTSILAGVKGYEEAASLSGVNQVVIALVGAAGLLPTLAAIGAGKDIALANKETLVMAGEIVMARAAAAGIRLLPIDSEHSAIFQCLNGHRHQDIEKIHLTASGGPFLNRADLEHIRPEEALNHPTWHMGPKISIDSATLMNKGLEVIEASWLFNLPARRIEVVVHPQSVVHSMVSFQDGTVLAQLGLPDMKSAISYALTYPERLPLNLPLPDFPGIGALTFQQPDIIKFPCLRLAFEAVEAGGTCPAVLNAANEIAVEAFLGNKIEFARIPVIIEKTMDRHSVVNQPSLSEILEADQWARDYAGSLV
ncbi:MAG: 1-deoxy-D-xylulose-5-phosphate reductoisomerase [Desulfobacterales bacterium]|nr:1-deoxy-D-xylulose-5-phosphate reductoisomerase [Desulfobacterales bacterium]